MRQVVISHNGRWRHSGANVRGSVHSRPSSSRSMTLCGPRDTCDRDKTLRMRMRRCSLHTNTVMGRTATLRKLVKDMTNK